MLYCNGHHTISEYDSKGNLLEVHRITTHSPKMFSHDCKGVYMTDAGKPFDTKLYDIIDITPLHDNNNKHYKATRLNDYPSCLPARGSLPGRYETNDCTQIGTDPLSPEWGKPFNCEDYYLYPAPEMPHSSQAYICTRDTYGKDRGDIGYCKTDTTAICSLE